MRVQEDICQFPDIELKGNWGGVPVRFVPIPQVEDDEYAIAYFPGYGYDFEIDSYSMFFKPSSRPVNLGDSQFRNLEGQLSASIVSIREYTDSNKNPITRVGLCYGNDVFNA